MGQALYRKYRSKSLAEVVGQDHITHTLQNALKSGHISHAYLFTGPRGVGKTSVARILAHEINNIPYEDDQAHLDIIEIDAASNRRIDEIRELRNKVHTAPTSAPYKVYIIDEVHMLTKEAFNALLKTLEEPPSHVIFILATTETHKLPETIISRTQRFAFKPVPEEQVVAHLRTIAEAEHIDISDEALVLIAQHGEGSFRDSISLLDQASGHDGKVDLAYVQSLLGVPPASSMKALREHLAGHDAVAVMQTITELQDQGYQPPQIARQLGTIWRSKLLQSGTAQSADFVLLQKLLEVPAAHNPERYLELLLLEFALQEARPQSTNPVTTGLPAAPAVSPPAEKAVTSVPKKASDKNDVPAGPTVKDSAVSGAASVFDEAIWPQVLDELKKKYNTLYGVVRMAQVSFQDNTLFLGFTFPFHRKRLSEAKNQQIIADIVQRLTGNAITIKCVDATDTPRAVLAAVEIVEDAAVISVQASETSPELPTKPDITTISNIFGGGELLES